MVISPSKAPVGCRTITFGRGGAGRGAVRVHLVGADAEAADAAKLGGAFQDPGVDVGAGSDPQVVGIADPFDECVFGQCRGVGLDILEAGIAQDPHGVLVDALH